VTQYTLNANFSADQPGTLADCNNTLGITGFTQMLPAGSFCNLRPYILTPGSPLGPCFVRLTDSGFGQGSGLLAQNGPGNIASATETEILFLFRSAGVDSASVFGKIRDTGTSVSGGQFYGLSPPSTTPDQLRLAFWQNNAQLNIIGSAVSKGFSANTWWWARIHVTAAGVWSWKAWLPPFSAEPAGWDSTGNSETTIQAGFVGVGMDGTTSKPTDYAWFSSATGGDSAVGPASNPQNTLIARPRRHRGGGWLGLNVKEWW